MKQFVFFILIQFMLTGISFATPLQETTTESNIEMADSLRADGKIYVVVLVVAIMFTFLMVYLLLTDRQVKKLENEMKDFKNSKN